jgi:hypothetical protein
MRLITLRRFAAPRAMLRRRTDKDGSDFAQCPCVRPADTDLALTDGTPATPDT